MDQGLWPDLPEIANSIIASATGHGEINVGDSVGSAVTQATVVLGLLCLTGQLVSPRRFVITTGSLTVLALMVGAVLMNDNKLSHTDGALLVGIWITGTLIIQKPSAAPEPDEATDSLVKRGILRTVAALAAVTVILARDTEHRWSTGLVLIVLYLVLYPALIV